MFHCSRSWASLTRSSYLIPVHSLISYHTYVFTKYVHKEEHVITLFLMIYSDKRTAILIIATDISTGLTILLWIFWFRVNLVENFSGQSEAMTHDWSNNFTFFKHASCFPIKCKHDGQVARNIDQWEYLSLIGTNLWTCTFHVWRHLLSWQTSNKRTRNVSNVFTHHPPLGKRGVWHTGVEIKPGLGDE